MAKTISKKSSAKPSEAKPLVKPPPGDKSFGVEPAISFYAIEYGDKTETGEEPEILVVYNSILATSEQNLVKRQFPYIDMFDHKGPVVNGVMRNLTAVVFEHLDIAYPMDVEKF